MKKLPGSDASNRAKMSSGSPGSPVAAWTTMISLTMPSPVASSTTVPVMRPHVSRGGIVVDADAAVVVVDVEVVVVASGIVTCVLVDATDEDVEDAASPVEVVVEPSVVRLASGTPHAETKKTRPSKPRPSLGLTPRTYTTDASKTHG